MIKRSIWIGLILFFLNAYSGGQLSPSPTARPETQLDIANVRQIEILKLEGEPIQVRVAA